jgi:hypothetical protein
MSKICKYAGDPTDEYCKNCDGVTMEVDNKKIACTECAGYEAGENEFMDVPEDMFEEDASVDATSTNNKEKLVEEANKTKKSNNNTGNNKNVKSTSKNKETINKKENKAVKVKEEKKAEEQAEISVDGIKIVSMRYTSGATIKKGDNYFKFVAEEEWDTSNVIIDIQDVREQLWAKLNCEVDKQIEELNSIN